MNLEAVSGCRFAVSQNARSRALATAYSLAPAAYEG